MNFFEYSSIRPSTRCSSRPVPSVTVIRAWVSPRWNTAEPCTRGSTSTWHSMARSVLRVAAVGPRAGQNQVADDLFFQRVPGMCQGVCRNGARGRRIGNHLGDDLRLEGGHGLGPGVLAGGLLGRAQSDRSSGS